MKKIWILLAGLLLFAAGIGGWQAKSAYDRGKAAEALTSAISGCASFAGEEAGRLSAARERFETLKPLLPKAVILANRTGQDGSMALNEHDHPGREARDLAWIDWHKPVVLPPVQTQSASRDLPYYIMVNRAQNTVTVYTKDADGNYTVPFKAMVCSTGRPGCETPMGEFSVMSFKAPWCYMIDGSYGQYSTGFREGGYLFHSICYTAKSKDAMMMDEYNMLGSFASAGCVRLQVADAKWIYDNCAVGTGVLVYDGDVPGPLGKPQTLGGQLIEESYNGWDPSDPDPENPWLAGN